MTDKTKADPMDLAERLNADMRGVSDLLLGAVRTLMPEGGWTEGQARDLVVRMFTQSPSGAK